MPTRNSRKPQATAAASRRMTVAEAARLLGVHRNTVQARILDGVIDAERNDEGKLRPLRASVLRYKAQQEEEGAAPVAA